MSDETPQKGWDSWFAGEPGSSGDEQQAAEQPVPMTQPQTQAQAQAGTAPAPTSAAPEVSAQETQVVRAPRHQGAAAPSGMPALERAPAESPAEQTSWTVPLLDSVLGGADAEATQMARPSTPAPTTSPTPPPTTTPPTSSRGRSRGYSAPGSGQGQESNPDQALTQYSAQGFGQGQSQGQGQESSPDQALTQYSGQGQGHGQGSKPDQAATQYSARGFGQGRESNPDQMPTQYSAQGFGQGQERGQESSPDQMPTQYSAQGLGQGFGQGQYPGGEATSTAGPHQQSPQQQQQQSPQQQGRPAWQVSEPAQMWSAAPGFGAATATGAGSAAAGYPQAGSGGPRGPQGAEGGGGRDWGGSGDDEEPGRRRNSPASAVGGGGTGPGGHGHGNGGDGGGPRSRKKLAVASGLGVAGIVALVTVLIMNQSGSGGSGASARSTPSGFQPTATTVAGDAQETAAAFLAAWQSGNFQQAANYTDDPAAAMAALSAYKDNLSLAGLQLTAQSATVTSSTGSATDGASTGASDGSSASAAPTVSGSVPFGVAAKVGLPAAATGTASAGASSSGSASSGASTSASSGSSAGTAASNVTANWSYTSKLTAYKKNGGWWVAWDPSVIAPNLTAGEKVVSVEIPPTASEVTDASGSDLSAATDPGVKNIAAALKKAAPAGQGTPGVQVEIEGANGTPIASTADVLLQPVSTGVVKTTIKPSVEAAAQTAVQKYPDSSMVVLQPSTGAILAVANNDGQNDFALTARVAPGSTNKIITSTALLANNLVTSTSQAVECPKSITVNGTVFANSSGESLPASTPFLDDFAASCNNAFGQWYSKIGAGTLAQTAQKYYGLNEQWNIGLGEAGPYYTIPSSASNGELFQELFGQGQLEAAPLAMASVAATVDSGSFKQPIVVPGAAQVSATPLPSNVQQDLYQMMKAVTTSSDGTAYGVFSGVSSQVYGKTGTADVGTGGTKQQNPNSWMVVFDPSLDIAIGCVVLNAGFGASFAGPETASVLKALQ